MLSKLIILSFLLYNLINCVKETSKCQLSELEDNLKSIIGSFGYKDQKWPENNKEMSEWCRSVQKDKILAKNFTLSCLKGMSRSIVSVTIYAGERSSRLTCKNKVERKNFITGGKCGNKAKKGTIKCWNNLITILTNVKKLPDSKDKIPTMCCSFFNWRDCNLNALRRAGANVCKESIVDRFMAYIDKSSLDPMRLLCSDYDESDKCDKFKVNFDKTRVDIKYKTMFPAIIDLFESL